jgi:hypothetical protein
MQLAQVQLGQTREDAAIGDASMDAFDFDIAL